MKNTIFRLENFKTGWLIPVIFLLFTSCSLIIEPDLTQSEVYLVAPIDDLVTNSNVITLWWDYVPDAEKYNLLIVSPGWESIEELVLDTNLTSSSITLRDIALGKEYSVATLPNGKYFCKVRSWDNAGNLGVFSDWKKFYISEE